MSAASKQALCDSNELEQVALRSALEDGREAAVNGAPISFRVDSRSAMRGLNVIVQMRDGRRIVRRFTPEDSESVTRNIVLRVSGLSWGELTLVDRDRVRIREQRVWVRVWPRGLGEAAQVRRVASDGNGTVVLDGIDAGSYGLQ